jgi:hypothetical protein
MVIFRTDQIKSWSVASKTKPIKAKPLITLLVDRTVVNKFLLDTLEGREPLGDGSVICVGEAGDIWQQASRKLLAKYVVRGIDKDGWMDCEPLPDNAVEVVEVTPSMCDSDGKIAIIGQWGATIDGATNVQTGKVGDYICRNRTDTTDQWIVARRFFLNTYSIKS